MKKSGVDPSIFLLSDYGYRSYQTTIETARAMVEEKPEVVQAFVDASILGWRATCMTTRRRQTR